MAGAAASFTEDIGPGLDPRGHALTVAVGRLLASKLLPASISSPLRRARETATPVHSEALKQWRQTLQRSLIATKCFSHYVANIPGLAQDSDQVHIFSPSYCSISLFETGGEQPIAADRL